MGASGILIKPILHCACHILNAISQNKKPLSTPRARLLSMLGGIKFRPKSSKAGYKEFTGSLPAPATFKRIKSSKENRLGALILICILLWFFNPFSLLMHLSSSGNYPKPHPYSTTEVIKSTSKYIYPPIEDAPTLKKMGIAELFRETKRPDPNVPGLDVSFIESLNVLDDPNVAKQKQKEETDNLISVTNRARNAFKNQDKVVFGPKGGKNYPKVIIVTAIDFDRYSVTSLATLVQNRVNYAHEQGYGLYVRWYQEFAAVMNSKTFLNSKERSKWARIYCLRSAMFAFPEAEWFWYLDQDGMIMNYRVNLLTLLLDKKSMETNIIKERPIIPPDGLIKTYKNLQPENVRLVLTQSESLLVTNSFLVKNDIMGRAIVDFWGDKLNLNYNNFPYGPDSVMTHVLQWHPFILSKAAIVPSRLINSVHTSQSLDPAKQATDKVHYFPGDFVVQWTCKGTDCDQMVKRYGVLLQNK